MNPNDITFSNRDKNTTSASPHFRPWRIPKPLAKAAHPQPLQKTVKKTAGSVCCRAAVKDAGKEIAENPKQALDDAIAAVEEAISSGEIPPEAP